MPMDRGEGAALGSRSPLRTRLARDRDGHVHLSAQSAPHLHDAAHKAANDAAYATCGITKPSKSTSTTTALTSRERAPG